MLKKLFLAITLRTIKNSMGDDDTRDAIFKSINIGMRGTHREDNCTSRMSYTVRQLFDLDYEFQHIVNVPMVDTYEYAEQVTAAVGEEILESATTLERLKMAGGFNLADKQ